MIIRCLVALHPHRDPSVSLLRFCWAELDEWQEQSKEIAGVIRMSLNEVTVNIASLDTVELDPAEVSKLQKHCGPVETCAKCSEQD